MTAEQGRRGTLGQLVGAVGWPFFGITFLGRLPLAMVLIAILTQMTVERGSLAEAGAASAATGIAAGAGGPLLGALADRVGQRWILTVAGAVNATAMLALSWAIGAAVPFAAVLCLCVVVGASGPQLSAFARARWVGLIGVLPEGPDAERRLGAAMGYEGLADELSYVCGPVLVGAIATAVSPSAPLWVAAALTLVFVLAFAWHPTRRYASGRRTRAGARPSVAQLSRLALPVGGMFFMGAFFGSALIAVTAFMQARDADAQSGLVYGAMAATSAACALLLSTASLAMRLSTRWVVAASILTVTGVLLLQVTAVAVLVPLLLFAGIGVGGTLVTIFTIGARSAPEGWATTVMALLSSGLVVGQALATFVLGQLASTDGFAAASSGVLIAAACGLAFALVHAAVGRRRAEGGLRPS